MEGINIQRKSSLW